MVGPTNSRNNTLGKTQCAIEGKRIHELSRAHIQIMSYPARLISIYMTRVHLDPDLDRTSRAGCVLENVDYKKKIKKNVKVVFFII